MNKHFALAFAVLLSIASQGYARQPFVYDPISETPSVLVKADAAVAPVAADAAVMARPESAPVVESDVIESGTAPMPSDGTVVESESAVATESAPVYRSRTYRKPSGGLVSELIQLERRKNAWIRRNVFGR